MSSSACSTASAAESQCVRDSTSPFESDRSGIVCSYRIPSRHKGSSTRVATFAHLETRSGEGKFCFRSFHVKIKSRGRREGQFNLFRAEGGLFVGQMRERGLAHSSY